MRTIKKGDPNKTIEQKQSKREKELKENLAYINEIDSRLVNTFYAIEADSYACHMIWAEYFFNIPKDKRKFEFVQEPVGISFEIGRIEKRPIMLSFRWYTINGHLVLFYDCTSQLADWKMVNEWLNKYMPHIKEKSDAMNAHNVLRYCEKKPESVPPIVIKCYTCMDSKQVEVRRIGYDSIMGKCPNC